MWKKIAGCRGSAEQHPWIVGVVGWVDLGQHDCERQVEEFKSFPKFVGVRHLQDEPDDNFIIRPEILLGLKVLERHGTALRSALFL